jgi:hypothetical protein
MNAKRSSRIRATLVIMLLLVITIGSSRLQADSGSCGSVTVTLPFTDVAGNLFFCDIAEAFFSGLTNGTTPTTYSPGQNVPREQMAAFITRTLDQSLKRGSKRTALKQFWTPGNADGLGITLLGPQPFQVISDGADLWVAHGNNGSVTRVRASNGQFLERWTGAIGVSGLLSAKGRVFMVGTTQPGSLYQIDPSQPVGAVTTLSNSLGDSPVGITFDGSRIWTSNEGGSVSIVNLNPLSVSNVTTGFFNPIGILYDGNNVWVTDGDLEKLDSNGAIIQTVHVGQSPEFPIFDGTNIWVPNNLSNSITVVRASTGAVVATLTGNGLNAPWYAAFDGERILVTNIGGVSVSLWKATDLSPLGSGAFGEFTGPFGACSDGVNFWITLNQAGELARF